MVLEIVAVAAPPVKAVLFGASGSDIPSINRVSGFETGPDVVLNPVIVTVADELALNVAMALAGLDSKMITPKAATIVAIILFLSPKTIINQNTSVNFLWSAYYPTQFMQELCHSR